ncbi:DCMP deaminase [Colletotrichum tofieldiae]|uniref:Deoxycytidylate deaminase n=1 Tax=Colletotrichum tofieldiae TaxID=708197 RepID=A0A161V3S3_9PEZI|nr:DCMP deaminase [Colletotrichum tofieldiae]
MLIGICGGICAGKKTVARYLVEHHGFKLLRLEDPSSTPPRDETPAYNAPQAPEPEFAPSSTGNDEPEAQHQSSSNKKGKKKKVPVCFTCKQKGHVKTDCPLPTQESDRNESPAREAGKSYMIVGAYSVVSKASHPYPPPTNGFHAPASNELAFSSADALLDYVTTRWQSRFVTTDVHNEAILDTLSRRPFFMLISVDAPLTVRHARFRALHNPHCTLESFALASDSHLYDPHQGLQPLISRATVRLLNTSSSLAHLYATLGKLQLADPVRLRPSWDAYFMSLAELASLRSNCMKRRVGAVLVGREKRVISTGYNGTPRGLQNCSDGGCSRCNSGNSSGVGLATCLCIHAEENALLEAGRERIREGAVLYCDTCPCLTCSIKICQVGIEEVVYAHGYSMDTETAAVFAQAGVRLRQYIPAPNGLIHLENLENLELY